MKIQAKIFQLIKWEDRKKYFQCVDWKDDGEYDLLHCGVTEDVSIREGFIGFFASIINKTYGKGYSQDAFAFNSNKGFPIWVKRPHEFIEGDLVEVNVTIKAVEIHSQTNVVQDNE